MKKENPEVQPVEEIVASEAVVPTEDVAQVDDTVLPNEDLDQEVEEVVAGWRVEDATEAVAEFDVAVEFSDDPLTLAFDDGTILTATFLQNEEYLNFLYTYNPVEYTKVMVSGHSANPVSYPFTS